MGALCRERPENDVVYEASEQGSGGRQGGELDVQVVEQHARRGPRIRHSLELTR